MVVQHNLTAMNSNRMLGVTTSKQANIFKLSTQRYLLGLHFKVVSLLDMKHFLDCTGFPQSFF